MSDVYNLFYNDPVFTEAMDCFKECDIFLSRYKTVQYLMEETESPDVKSSKIEESNKTLVKKVISIISTSLTTIAEIAKKALGYVMKGLNVAYKIYKKVDKIILEHPKIPGAIKALYTMIFMQYKFYFEFIHGLCGDIRKKDGKGVVKRLIHFELHEVAFGGKFIRKTEGLLNPVLNPVVLKPFDALSKVNGTDIISTTAKGIGDTALGWGSTRTLCAPLPSAAISNDIIKVLAKYKILFTSDDIMDIPSTKEIITGFAGGVKQVTTNTIKKTSETLRLDKIESNYEKVDPKAIEKVNRLCKKFSMNMKLAETYCKILSEDLSNNRYTIVGAAMTAKQIKKGYKREMNQKKKTIKKNIKKGLNLDMKKPTADVDSILSAHNIKR